MNATSSVPESMSRPSRITFLPSLGILLVTGGFFCWCGVSTCGSNLFLLFTIFKLSD